MMDILILGAGKVGGGIARELVKNNCDVTVVDSDNNQGRKLQSKTDLRFVRGNASDPAVLREAGVQDADIVVAVTASDETNLVASRLCKLETDTIRTIARIRSRRYTDDITRAGFSIDRAFCPETLVAEGFRNAIEFPSCQTVHRFADGHLALAGIRISSKTDIAGNSVGDLRQIIKEIDYRIVALYRDNEMLPAEADTRLFVGDTAYLLVATSNLRQLAPLFAGPHIGGQRVFMAGGGNIGLRVAKLFDGGERVVKLVERNVTRCKTVSHETENIMVLKGDASDKDLLQQEGIEEFDIFCALTNDDEENIFSAIQAKRMGAKRSVSLINHVGYLDILARELDIVISPSRLTIGSMLSEIRQGEIRAVHAMPDGASEAVELIVVGNAANSNLVGREVQNIAWPAGVIPGAIVQDDPNLAPQDRVRIIHHNTQINQGDRVICFVIGKPAAKKLAKFIQVKAAHLG